MRNHDVMADYSPVNENRVIRLNIGWIDTIFEAESQEIAEGLAVLAAVVDLYILAVIGNAGQRETLHILRDFIVSLPATDKESLQAVLYGKVIDSNNSFSSMITLSEDVELAQSLEQLDLATFLSIRTCVLYEAGNALEQELFKTTAGRGNH